MSNQKVAITVTLDDGQEEGNEWELFRGDEQALALFEQLCTVVMGLLSRAERDAVLKATHKEREGHAPVS